MDIAHQGEREHTIHKAERPHEERELKKNPLIELTRNAPPVPRFKHHLTTCLFMTTLAVCDIPAL